MALRSAAKWLLLLRINCSMLSEPMETIELKRLKGDVQNSIDEALDRFAGRAERWAGYVRLFFAFVFALAAAVAWRAPDARRWIYILLAASWLVAFILVRLRVKADSSASFATLTTLVDLTIVNSGLLLFVWQRPGVVSGAGLFLLYFPILAVAAMRYRAGLVIAAGLYSSAFYAIVSLMAIGSPWFRISMLLVTTIVAASASRKPKEVVTQAANSSLQQAFEMGVKHGESGMNALFHEAVFPPAILDLPSIWSSSKHSPGSEVGGDYYQVFETERGPLVVVADIGGTGPGDVRDVALLHQTMLRIVLEDSSLPGVLDRLHAYVWQTYKGERKLTGFIARWEGEELEYASAGHPPALHVGRASIGRLDATAGPIGERADETFTAKTVPFPARDMLMVFTDGLYRKLADNPEQGVAQIESLAEQFSNGEVNTLCHRVFDCAQPGLDAPKEDCTLVVVRRQPKAAEESKQKTSAEA
jgi:hypothetical protein